MFFLGDECRIRGCGTLAYSISLLGKLPLHRFHLTLLAGMGPENNVQFPFSASVKLTPGLVGGGDWYLQMTFIEHTIPILAHTSFY
jgi:hypothetical protein